MRFFRKLKEILVLILKGREGYARFLGVDIGKNCRIITTSWGTEAFLIKIGNNVTVTDGVKFFTYDGSACLSKMRKDADICIDQSIIIGDNVFIGVNAISC